jgi:hypothetical protein
MNSKSSLFWNVTTCNLLFTDVSEEPDTSTFSVSWRLEKQVGLYIPKHTELHPPEESNLHSERCEEFKSH